MAQAFPLEAESLETFSGKANAHPFANKNNGSDTNTKG